MSIRDHLKAEIVGANTPAKLAALAHELRELADVLDARSAALRNDRERPPQSRLSSGAHIKRGPGRQPADFIRIERIMPAERHGDSRDANIEQAQEKRYGNQQPKLRLYIGKALYRIPEFGQPPYIRIAFIGKHLVIVPEQEPGKGHYRVVEMGGIPRCWIDSAREQFKDIQDGRYIGFMLEGVLAIGAPIV